MRQEPEPPPPPPQHQRPCGRVDKVERRRPRQRLDESAAAPSPGSSARPRLRPGTRLRRARPLARGARGAGPEPLTASAAGGLGCRIWPIHGPIRAGAGGAACRWLSLCLRTQLTFFLGFILDVSTFEISSEVNIGEKASRTSTFEGPRKPTPTTATDQYLLLLPPWHAFLNVFGQ